MPAMLYESHGIFDCCYLFCSFFFKCLFLVSSLAVYSTPLWSPFFFSSISLIFRTSFYGWLNVPLFCGHTYHRLPFVDLNGCESGPGHIILELVQWNSIFAMSCPAERNLKDSKKKREHERREAGGTHEPISNSWENFSTRIFVCINIWISVGSAAECEEWASVPLSCVRGYAFWWAAKCGLMGRSYDMHLNGTHFRREFGWWVGTPPFCFCLIYCLINKLLCFAIYWIYRMVIAFVVGEP